MPIIKHGHIEESSWVHLADEDALPEQGACTVSAERWLSAREELSEAAKAGRLGLRVSGDTDLEAIAGDLASLALVAVAFASLADGRGFSVARLLRDAYGYKGELRAYGNFLPDQLQFMTRCGFDSFEFTSERDLEKARALLTEFSVSYQSGTDAPPLYRRQQG
ncbi:MAG: hypothetical protein RIQ52_539 [Pseudomonadota bacterium]|jgi:uncharacterized protein (DUF934 family)